VPPFHSLSHHSYAAQHGIRGAPLFWIAERDFRLSSFIAGQDSVLSFVDIEGNTVTPDDAELIDADLRCTNRDLPSLLQSRAPRNDFVYTDNNPGRRITFLRRPTALQQRPENPERHWDLVAMLSAHPFNLDRSGLPALKRLLSAHVLPGSQFGARQIDAIVGLARASGTRAAHSRERQRSRVCRMFDLDVRAGARQRFRTVRACV
jgi:type VI secretion system protein ImpG